MDILFRRIGKLVQGLTYLDRVRHMHISSCGADSGIPKSIEFLVFVLRQFHFLSGNLETPVLALQEREGIAPSDKSIGSVWAETKAGRSHNRAMLK